MKRITEVITLMMMIAGIGYSQNVNWRALAEEQRNLIQLNVGYDYGVTAQIGYGRSFTFIRPVLLGVDYSFPMGRDLVDDFKVRLGGQMEAVQIGGFSATVRILANFRRYQNALVRIVGFGSDFAAVAGYYRPGWYAAGEFGFDKSITSFLKHSDLMRSFFPGIKDGWYVPLGGNYYYGLQAGKTIGERFGISLRLGATAAQAHDENAVLPYYAQLGLGLRF